MRKSLLYGAVALAISAAPALAQTSNPQSNPRQGTAPQTSSPRTNNPPADTQAKQPPAAAKANADDRFVMNMAHDGMAEVELGKLAQSKASSDDVKQFAQRMVDDHSKANDELKTLAQNKNITLPATADPKHKAIHDRLEKLSGASFDRAYMTEMVNGHRMVANELRAESKSGKDADVKAWAAKTLPTVEEHLKVAQSVNSKAVGTAGKADEAKPKGGAGVRK